MMKKFLIAILIVASTFPCVMLGQNKKLCFGFQAEQTFALNTWFDDAWINEGINAMNSTNLKGNINWSFYKNWGVSFDLSVGFFSSYSIDIKEDIPFTNLNPANYYNVHEKVDTWPEPLAKMTFGIHYKFNRNKFYFIPILGLGFDEAKTARADYSFKEKNSNNRYDVNYAWFFGSVTNSTMQPVLSIQLLSIYKMTKTMGLSFGVIYRHCFCPPSFSARVTDYYDHSLIYETSVKGKQMNTLSLSLGLSFR